MISGVFFKSTLFLQLTFLFTGFLRVRFFLFNFWSHFYFFFAFICKAWSKVQGWFFGFIYPTKSFQNLVEFTVYFIKLGLKVGNQSIITITPRFIKTAIFAIKAWTFKTAFTATAITLLFKTSAAEDWFAAIWHERYFAIIATGTAGGVVHHWFATAGSAIATTVAVAKARLVKTAFTVSAKLFWCAKTFLFKAGATGVITIVSIKIAHK